MNRANFFSAGDTKGGDADVYAFYLFEGVAATDESGASGEDVVDKEYVMSFELFGMSDTKSTLDIALAVGGAGETLLTGMAVTDKRFGVHFARHHFGDTAAKQLALVISSLEPSAPVERYRH